MVVFVDGQYRRRYEDQFQLPGTLGYAPCCPPDPGRWCGPVLAVLEAITTDNRAGHAKVKQHHGKGTAMAYQAERALLLTLPADTFKPFIQARVNILLSF